MSKAGCSDGDPWEMVANMGFSYRVRHGIASRMDVSEMSADLAETMARQLRLRSGRFADVAARAGRKLPRHLQAEAQAIVEAQTLAEHPKLAYRIDEKRLKRAERKLRAFLDKQNPRAERRAEILDRLAAIVFVIFVAVLGVFLIALWRGAFD